MEQIIINLIPYIPNAAIPIIICFCFYIYIQSKRKETKNIRDKDSQDIHDILLNHTFEITNLKGQQLHTNDIQDDLQKQLYALSEAVAKLSISVELFSKAVDDLRHDIKK